MPLPPEDLLAIQELYARYNHAIDSGDPDAWVATFTADGAFATNLSPAFSGAEQLRAFAVNLCEQLDARHWNNNLIIEPAPGGAKGVCYLLLVRPGSQGVLAEVGATGIYRDELAKGPGGWKFKSRNATIEGEVPMKR